MKSPVHKLRRPSVGFARGRAIVVLISVLASMSVVAALPASSSASATGCTASGFGIKWFSSSYTCIDVEGPPTLAVGPHDQPSLWVSTVQMSWVGAGTVCNWKMVLRWTNVNGRVYRTDSSAVHTGCRVGSAVYVRNYGHPRYSPTYGSYWGGMKMQTGRVCGYLYESGALRQGVPCESIHP